MRNSVARRLAVTAGGAGFAILLAAGCASPAPPLAPSLKLPEVVAASSLTASRVGDGVILRWTTPSRTTDKLLIAGSVTAEICREAVSGASRVGAKCVGALKVTVAPGDNSEAVDTLPVSLTSGPPVLLAYRVELLNAAGRTAGPSVAVFAAGGSAPAAVEGLQAKSTKGGVVVEWRRADGPDAVELVRTTVEAPARVAPVGGKNGLPSAKDSGEARFRAGSADSGGTVDRTVQIGWTYSYTAQRVRSVTVGGQSLEVRSAAGTAVTVAVANVFPPDVPAGLVAVPSQGGDKAAIDLSWDPNMEPRIAGYRVYRREGDSDAWQRLGDELVGVPAYRDMTVVSGRKYAYRVTAVNDAGNESGPSGEVVETAAGQ